MIAQKKREISREIGRSLSSSACLCCLYRLLWTAIFSTVIFLLPVLWFSFSFSVASHIFFLQTHSFLHWGQNHIWAFFSPLMWRLRLKGINRASKWNSISTKSIHTHTHRVQYKRTHPQDTPTPCSSDQYGDSCGCCVSLRISLRGRERERQEDKGIKYVV